MLIEVAAATGTYVRRRGEDLVAGQAVLEAGRTLTPIEVGIAAALGHDSVRVGRRPRVVVCHRRRAGHRRVGARPRTGRRFEVPPMVIAAVREAGGEPTFMGIAADTADDVRGLLQRADFDIIVSSAGVSVGAHDHVRDVVAERRRTPRGHAPRQADAHRHLSGRALFLGLPGNPVSASVTFEFSCAPPSDASSSRGPRSRYAGASPCSSARR